MPKPLIQMKGTRRPYFKLFAVYGKPLLDERKFDIISSKTFQDSQHVQKALKLLTRELLKRLRAGIAQTVYSSQAKTLLSKCLKVEVRESSLVVRVNHPAFVPLMLGQKKQQMIWLLKAKAPIPIITEDGDLIFRSATPRSMANGGWVHPGRPSTGVVEKARVEAREAIKERIAKEINNNIRKSLTGRT